jgi:hypothetical protein
MSKRIMIGLLSICLLALLVSGADAAVCVKKIGSTCVMWSGTVICGIDVSGLGNCIDDPRYLGCSAQGSGSWVVACGNPGTNNWTAPGVNVVNFDGAISGETLVEPSMCDANGNAFVEVTATISQEMKDALLAAGACPNTNWVVADAVPCTATITDQETDANDCVIADATFECTLPSCETLGWDIDTQKFERRQYDCVRTSYNRYKTPICP